MKYASYDDLFVFVEVVRANGFRAAAENLNIGAGSVSETVQRIESRLGVRLIERTTRKIALTSEGKELFNKTLPALADLKNAIDELGDDQSVISGTLRLSAPRSGAAFFLDEVISEFVSLYPKANVDVLYDDNKVDLVSSGVDAVIRSQTLLEKETHATQVGPELDMALVASPDYLEKNGIPNEPTDIMHHDGICFTFGGSDRLAPWRFREGSSSLYIVTPRPRMIVNDLMSMNNFARTGLGLAYTYKRPVEPYIESGELVSLLEEFVPSLPRYSINYLTKRHMPARLRAFIDLAKKYK